MTVLDDRRVDIDAVADRPFDRVAAAVEDRLERLDRDACGGLLCLRKRHDREILTEPDGSHTLLRDPAASDLAAERRTRRARLSFRRLAGSGRTALVASP